VSVYLYAIAGAEAEVPAGGGLHGASVRAVRTPALSAVVSNAEGAESLTAESDLWDHELVVEQLMDDNDVLPVRFGTVLGDESEVERLLVDREDELKGALERVAGCVEVSVRAAILAPSNEHDTERPGSGTEYMQEALRRRLVAEHLSESIDRSLGPLARESRITPSADAGRTVTGAWLIDRGRLAEFRDRAAQLNADTEYAELVCTGPWPPYSFVGAGEG
jgi:hypothetical protein